MANGKAVGLHHFCLLSLGLGLLVFCGSRTVIAAQDTSLDKKVKVDIAAQNLSPALIEFSQHNVMNPIINVQGDRATGEWYFMGPFKFRQGQQARWLALQYKDDYVKLNGQWKYKHLRINLRLLAPYDEGWDKQLIATAK